VPRLIALAAALLNRARLEQPGGLGVEAPQEAAIGGHLRLQDQRWQLRPLWWR
jgi:hypothetical protein